MPLLDEIETYNESKRFKRESFEKYVLQFINRINFMKV